MLWISGFGACKRSRFKSLKSNLFIYTFCTTLMENRLLAQRSIFKCRGSLFVVQVYAKDQGSNICSVIKLKENWLPQGFMVQPIQKCKREKNPGSNPCLLYSFYITSSIFSVPCKRMKHEIISWNTVRISNRSSNDKPIYGKCSREWNFCYYLKGVRLPRTSSPLHRQLWYENEVGYFQFFSKNFKGISKLTLFPI